MFNQIRLFRAEKSSSGGIEKVERIESGVYMGKAKSVRMSEYYSAKQAGLEPSLVFDMWRHEYSGEEYAQVDNFGEKSQLYRVERIYESAPDRIELTLVRTGLKL